MRLTVVLPAHRLWQWHRRLIASLAASHEVAVVLDDRAPPYPPPVRLWMRMEQAVFGPQGFAQPCPPEALAPTQTGTPAPADIVIDLSEYPDGFADAIDIRYNGVPDSTVLIETLLARSTPVLSAGRTGDPASAAQSRPAISDKGSLLRGLDGAFGRCAVLVERALRGPSASASAPAYAAARSSLAAFVLRATTEKLVGTMLKPLRRRDHWAVALRDGSNTFTPVADYGERFYADPFLYRWGGRTYLFVEEYPYATGRGIIAAAEIRGGRVVAPPAAVLQRPYHLSYPFVFEDGGNLYMLPETGENRTLELYRATEFPWRWELDRVLMDGAVFSDATPLFHDGRWWLFVMADAFGAATQDELFLFHSETLDGPWRPHPANPVKSDCRSSRSAGRVVSRAGRLFRPAQDCEESYGAGLAWFEITQLTATSYAEREVARWNGRSDIAADGLHTFDQLGTLQVIDFRRSIGRGLLHRDIAPFTPTPNGALAATLPPDASAPRFGPRPDHAAQVGF